MSTFSITTKAGDQGTTGLLDHQRVAKYDLRPEAYGTLDEANAFIGLARVKTDLSIVKEILLNVQNHLYLINSELACPTEHLALLKRRIGAADLQELERYSSKIEQQLALPRKFVLYGATEVSAYLDVARAVLRRAERRVVELNSLEKIENDALLPYLNRLSDSLFLLARYEEFAHNVPYQHPEVL
jgi:cob(I)alamin adenosyltransferase